ncbi:MAG: sensor histidine kinase, partial [Gemmatimonadetes bacterium]
RVLVDEVARLDEMARSFSQFGRMPDGPAAPVDLVELLEGLTAPFGRTVTLHVPPGGAPHVHGHVDALGRVLRNLVVNALEAAEVHSGPDGARVHVALAADDEAVVVTVDDNGPGVPPELRDDIWSPDVTTKRRGTGLGLALVRQTVLHHGGTVHVGEAPGGGARFTVRLPLGGAAAEAEDPTGRSGASTPTETA